MNPTLIKLSLLFFLSHSLLAQNMLPNQGDQDALTSLRKVSIQFDRSTSSTTKSIFSKLSQELGNSADFELISVSSQTGNGWKHDRYQQYYKGSRILGAQLILHLENDHVSHISGLLAENAVAGLEGGFLQDEALEKILIYGQKHWKGQSYSGKIDRSFPIRGEAVYCDKKYPQSSGILTKAWLFEIYTLSPLEKRRVLIDAMSGEIIMDIQALMSCGSHAHNKANSGTPTRTLYHGDQEISLGFIGRRTLGLRKELPGTVVEVLKDDTTHFTDDDGFFLAQDTALWSGAVDAYWSTLETMDFYYHKFLRRGITNQDNDTARSFMLPLDLPYNNAFWDGASMFYGKGDGDQFGPFTSIDICAHEVTHGVTQFTSGLEYTHESGAMNEAFSDIFGKTVEFERSNENFSWELGGRIGLDSLLPPGEQGFRNMADPWKYTNPKFYKGRFWYTGRFDNGGVHFNSGVLNYWYYLLVEGGAGMNEKGESYDVSPIGFEKAIDLAYDVLTNYLTPTSQYIDAKEASMISIALQYGSCSPEHESVAAAWHAVGLGQPILPPDLSASTYKSLHDACIDSEFNPQILITNNSCNSGLPQGTIFKVYYEHKGGTRVSEQLTLPDEIAPGGTYLHPFSSFITNSEIEHTNLLVGFESTMDTIVINNEYSADITWRLGPNFDLSIIPVFDNRPICERGSTTEVFIAGEYSGCTPIFSSDSILVTLELNGAISANYVRPLRTIYPGGYALFDNFPIENLKFGQNRAKIKLEYARDPRGYNNWQQVDFYVIDHISSNHFEDFESPESIDSSLLSITQGKYVNHNVQTDEGKSTIVLTGSSIFNSDSSLRLTTLRDRANMLLTEHQFLSNIHLCYDGKQFIDPVLEIELKHEPGELDYTKYGILEDASTLTSLHWDGFVEYLINIPVNEFVEYSYPLPKMDTIAGLTIRNLTLSGNIDPVTGEVLPGSDRILYNYIRIRDRSLSVEHEITQMDLILYPNPATDMTQLSRNNGQKLPQGEIVIFSSNGQLVSHEIINESWSHQLSLGDIPEGIYTVLIKPEHGDQSIFKLIKLDPKTD